MVITNATGIWDVSDYGSTPKFNAATSQDELKIENKDKKILRDLAEKVYELSLRSVEKEKRNLWISHNSLQHTRPVIFCDPENGWNEIITDNQLECSSSLSRRWEMVLRKEIFWGESMLDDKVIEPNFDIGYTHSESDWGVQTIMHGGHGGSYVWVPSIKEISDIDKIHFPSIEVDYKTTQKTYELATEIFGDFLKIRIRGVWWWSFGLTFTLALFRGLEQIMFDIVDNPKVVHRLMKILKDGSLAKLDFLEKNDLLSLNLDSYVGSGGFGYTNELPAKDFNGHVRAKDMWGFAESQETIGISPKMFEEFIFPYQLPILKRFGLNCYGCCEPLDPRWYVVKNTPNLRRVSVSPFANLEKMAGFLQDKYVLSYKPNPSYIAVPLIDEDFIRKNLRKVFNITKDCIVEVIMKDNHTIGKNPNNVIRYVKIARQEAETIL